MSAAAGWIRGGSSSRRFPPARRRGARTAERAPAGSVAASAASVGIVGMVMLVLFGPLAILAVFSFNSSTIISLPFERFTTRWYQEAFTSSGARDSMLNSAIVATIVMILCLIIGTMAAIGLTRTRFRLRGMAAALHGAPLVIPSLIIGVAAVMFFSALQVELSLATLTVMHVVAIFPLVTAIVAAGLVRFERAPEEAAIDLGASQWQMVRYVMLPQIAPSLAAAGLYAFFESFNSFELSFFTGGYQQTFPVWVYALLKHGDNLPIINAAATFIAVVQVLIVLGGWMLVRRLIRRQAGGRSLSDVIVGARR